MGIRGLVGGLVECGGCGAMVPDSDGANHEYLGSSAGCFEVFGEVLAREYSDVGYAAVHNLTVDVYALQHPGREEARTIKSAAVHLISLYLQLEQGWDSGRAARAKQKAAGQGDKFAWLEPPGSPGEITIVEVHAAQDAAEHRDLVKRWAASVWEAWSEYHETVKGWTGLYVLE